MGQWHTEVLHYQRTTNTPRARIAPARDYCACLRSGSTAYSRLRSVKCLAQCMSHSVIKHTELCAVNVERILLGTISLSLETGVRVRLFKVRS